MKLSLTFPEKKKKKSEFKIKYFDVVEVFDLLEALKRY